MTNHPKFTESHDSAARSVGYEGARESRDGRPFYWTAPPCYRKCDCAPTGWYQWTADGLKYLGESILDPMETCKCGALRKDHSHAENHSFVLDEFLSQSSPESCITRSQVSAGKFQCLERGI